MERAELGAGARFALVVETIKGYASLVHGRDNDLVKLPFQEDHELAIGPLDAQGIVVRRALSFDALVVDVTCFFRRAVRLAAAAEGAGALLTDGTERTFDVLRTSDRYALRICTLLKARVAIGSVVALALTLTLERRWQTSSTQT